MDGCLTNLFASLFQNSQLRKKLNSTTFLLPPLTPSSPLPSRGAAVPARLEPELNKAACRNLNTSQLLVTPMTEVTSVREERGGGDT